MPLAEQSLRQMDLFPKLVFYYHILVRDADGNLGINYSGIIPILVKAVQEQQLMIDKLRAKVFA